MQGSARAALLAILPLLWCGAPACAESMRCQSVNGNTNCAGSGAVSCQTVNGKTVCTSEHGDVQQSFGKHGTTRSGVPDAKHPHVNNPAANNPAANNDDGDDPDDDAPAPSTRQRVEQRGPRGQTMTIDRNGNALHLRSDRLSIDRN